MDDELEQLLPPDSFLELDETSVPQSANSGGSVMSTEGPSTLALNMSLIGGDADEPPQKCASETNQAMPCPQQVPAFGSPNPTVGGASKGGMRVGHVTDARGTVPVAYPIKTLFQWFNPQALFTQPSTGAVLATRFGKVVYQKKGSDNKCLCLSVGDVVTYKCNVQDCSATAASSIALRIQEEELPVFSVHTIDRQEVTRFPCIRLRRLIRYQPEASGNASNTRYLVPVPTTFVCVLSKSIHYIEHFDFQHWSLAQMWHALYNANNPVAAARQRALTTARKDARKCGVSGTASVAAPAVRAPHVLHVPHMYDCDAPDDNFVVIHHPSSLINMGSPTASLSTQRVPEAFYYEYEKNSTAYNIVPCTDHLASPMSVPLIPKAPLPHVLQRPSTSAVTATPLKRCQSTEIIAPQQQSLSCYSLSYSSDSAQVAVSSRNIDTNNPPAAKKSISKFAAFY